MRVRTAFLVLICCLDVLGSTRKYVIPLLEYFDKAGLTERKDSVRLLKAGYGDILRRPEATETTDA